MSQPIFRSDLKITTHRTKEGGRRYLVVRPEDQETFELSAQNFSLCCQLNGRSSIEAVRKRFETEFNVELKPDTLAAFIQQLSHNKLLVADDARKTPMADTDRTWIPMRTICLGNLQPFLNTLIKRLGWCFTPIFVSALFGFLVVLGCVLYSKSGLLFEQTALLWSVTPFSNVVLCWIVAMFFLNLPHEIAHGLAVVHYGGRVKDWGIRLWFNVIPAFYCDIKDIVWLRGQSQRIAVLAAGLCWQVLMVEVGLIGWRLTLGSYGNQLFLALTTVAGFALILNSIPLLNRDGYFIMIQWLGTPNLRQRAFSFVRAWLLRRPVPEPLTARERIGFALYAVLAVPCSYLPFIVTGFGRQVVGEYQGPGALMVVAGVMVLFQRSITEQLDKVAPVRWYKRMLFGKGRRRLTRYVTLFLLILLMTIPYPYETGGPFRLVPYHQVEVRARVEGEVAEVFVTEGQQVHVGDKLATLNRRIHEKDLKIAQEHLISQDALLRIAKEGVRPKGIDEAKQVIQTAKVRLEYSTREAKRLEKLYRQKIISEQEWDDAKQRQDLDAEKLAQAEVALANLESGTRPDSIKSSEAEVRQAQVEVEHLQENLVLTTLVSPINGLVTTPYPNEHLGHFLEEGDVFVTVQDQSMIQAEVEVPEGDIGDVQVGSEARIKMWAYPNRTFLGKVASIAPVAIIGSTDRFVRVLTNIQNPEGLLKPEMTGYAKIESETRPLGIVLTRLIVRFFLVQVWYWVP